MTTNSESYLVAALLATLCVTAMPGVARAQDKAPLIDEFIDNAMACSWIPGYTLSIAWRESNGQTNTYVQGYGKANVDRDVNVTSKTLFHVASVTKAFTAVLLAILLEDSDGRYGWETPVRDILGDSFLMPDEYMTERTNLLDLLAHKVGLKAEDGIYLFGLVTDPDELTERLHLIERDSEFRTNFVYSNVMYTLAGAVAEKIGGKSWQQLIQEKILNPLGMDSTSFVGRVDPEDDMVARAYYLMNNRTLVEVDYSLQENMKAVGPAGGLVSNAEDMARWMHFVVSGGLTPSNQPLLSKEALLRVLTPENRVSPSAYTRKPEHPVSDTLDTYTLGWYSGYYRGYPHKTHSGSLLGYESMLTILPMWNAAVFVSANGAMTEVSVLANRLITQYVLDSLMDVEPWLSLEAACSFADQFSAAYLPGPYQFDREGAASRHLGEYVGRYGSFLYGDVEVSLGNSTSALELRGGTILQFALYPSKMRDSFYCEGLGAASFYTARDSYVFSGPAAARTTNVTFTVDDDDVITNMTFTVWGLDPMVFQKGLHSSQAPKPDFAKDKCSSGSTFVCTVSQWLLLLTVMQLYIFCPRYIY